MNQLLHKNYQDLNEVAQRYKSDYQNATPFPNIHFENFFDTECLDAVLNEFPDLSQLDALKFDNEKEKKLAGKGEYIFGTNTKALMHYLNSQPFLEFLQKLTGIKETLIGDPYFVGGGLHEIKRGGLLKIHTDFNKHYTTGLDRRINVLVYLNKDWKEDYGGQFELWNKDVSRCEKKITPHFNTMAIFSTTNISYHGHPDALNCPENRSRKSLALYYYTNGRPLEEVGGVDTMTDTVFKERQNIDQFETKAEKRKANAKIGIKDFIPPILIKLKRKLW